MLDEIRKELAESFKHRHVEDASCIACGRANAPLALHIIEFYHPDKIETPSPLVAMSQSRGTTRGGVPLCSACCPPCTECGLPIATPWTKKLLAALTTKYQGITFVSGNGFCRHVHVLHDFKSLFRCVKLSGSKEPDLLEDNGRLSLGGAIKDLMEQDTQIYKRGESPEARLVPHHAIKRDFIIAAYTKDFQAHVKQLESMEWTATEKARRITEAKVGFEKHIYGVKRLGWPELDKIIALMKNTRTDFRELENEVRSKGFYPFAEPL